MPQFTVRFANLTLTAATVRTLAMVTAASAKRVRLIEACISFGSVTTSDVPAFVELYRATSAGTNTSFTPLLDDPSQSAEVAQAAGAVAFTSTEPTTGDIVRNWNVPVQGGLLSYQLPLGGEIWVPVSTRIALRATAAQTQTTNVSGYLVFVE